jgi:hypothetical protein|tara:strand:- start:14 stop:589 length:576 start_codon:yes stop_codon:yes gene_type:complete
MKVYEYKNYEEYLENQIEANVKKLKNIYVEKRTIRKICEDKKQATKILCHGTRNAAEQFYFKESFPDAEIIGTEVSHTASKFPMTVQHDFNNVREDWVGYFDVVYSNAFDHCFDPIRTIKVWSDQMSSTGKLYLEHGYGPDDNNARPWDPVEIYDDELRQLFKSTGLQLESTFESTGLKGKVPCRVYVLTK